MKLFLCLSALMAVVTVHTAPIDSAKIRFKISARDLPDKDTLGTIDPYVEIFYTDEGQKEEVRLGRTSTLTDQENPDWGDVFEFDFVRAKRQRWHFKVYDHDNGREDDKAGIGYVDVADFVDKNQHINVNLNKKGFLILSSNEPVTPATSVPGQLQNTQVVQTVPVVQTGHVLVDQTGTILVPQTGGPYIAPQAHTVVVPDKAKLRFKLSANNLPDKDKLGSTDPYVELYYTEGTSTDEKKFGRTATHDNTKNPQFGEVFEFDYDRSKQQKWLFKIYDHDQGREDDSAGKVWVEVNDYVQKGQSVTVNLSKRGTLTITNASPQTGSLTQQQPQVLAPAPIPVQPQPQQTHHVAPITPAPVSVQNQLTKIKFRLSANGLEDKDIIGTSDPHVKIFSKIGSEPEVKIGSTTTITDNENPIWPHAIEYEYDASKQPKLRFLVLDEDDGRRDDELGEAWLDLNEYMQKNQDMTLSLKKGTLNVRKA